MAISSNNNIQKKQVQDNPFLKLSQRNQQGLSSDNIWGNKKAGATQGVQNPFDTQDAQKTDEHEQIGATQEKDCNEYFGEDENGEMQFDQNAFYDDALGLSFSNSKDGANVNDLLNQYKEMATKDAKGNKYKMQELKEQIKDAGGSTDTIDYETKKAGAKNDKKAGDVKVDIKTESDASKTQDVNNGSNLDNMYNQYRQLLENDPYSDEAKALKEQILAAGGNTDSIDFEALEVGLGEGKSELAKVDEMLNLQDPGIVPGRGKTSDNSQAAATTTSASSTTNPSAMETFTNTVNTASTITNSVKSTVELGKMGIDTYDGISNRLKGDPADVKAAKQDVDAAEKKLNDETKNVQKATTNFEKASQELESANQEKENLSKELQGNEPKYQELDAQEQAAESEKADATSQKDDLRKEQKSQHDEADKQQGIYDKQNKIFQEQNKLATETIPSQITNVDKEISRLSGDKKNDCKISELRQQRAKLVDQKTAAEKKAAEAKRQMEAAQRAKGKAEEAEKQAKGKADTLEKTTIPQIDEKITKIKEQMEKLNVTDEKIKTRIHNANEKVQTATKNKSTAETDKKAAEGRQKEAQTQLSTAKAALEKAKASHEKKTDKKGEKK